MYKAARKVTSVVKKMLLVVLKLHTTADCRWAYKAVLGATVVELPRISSAYVYEAVLGRKRLPAK